MRLLYANSTLTPLCAVLLALVACGPSGQSARPNGELAALPAWTAAPTPQAAADQFVGAWNRGERANVLAMYAPDRRPVIAASPDFEQRLRHWRALDADVPDQCHPRGAYYKIVEMVFEDRRSGAKIAEIVWLHLKDGGWWVYSI